MTAYIGYDNKIDAATVTVTSEVTGFEKENAYDNRSNDSWNAGAAGTVYFTVDLGSAVAIDWWGVAFHNLANNSGTIKPQYSTDNFAADTNDLDTVQTPSDASVIFRNVTQRTVRYFRFEIVSTGSPSNIGAFYFGSALALQRGLPPGFITPKLARINDVTNYKSEGGHFIGRSVVSEGRKFSIKQKVVTPAWIDSNWEALADSLEIAPFWYVWDQENRPTEAAWCWTDKRPKYPKYTDAYFQDFEIKCMGRVK